MVNIISNIFLNMSCSSFLRINLTIFDKNMLEVKKNLLQRLLMASKNIIFCKKVQPGKFSGFEIVRSSPFRSLVEY